MYDNLNKIAIIPTRGGAAITNNQHYGHRLQMARNQGEAVFVPLTRIHIDLFHKSIKNFLKRYYN